MTAVGEIAASVHELSEGSPGLRGDPGFLRARRNGKNSRILYTITYREFFWKWTEFWTDKESVSGAVKECRWEKERLCRASQGLECWGEMRDICQSDSLKGLA